MKYHIILLIALIFPFSLYGEASADIQTIQKQFVAVLSTSQQKSLEQLISDFPIKYPALALQDKKTIETTEDALSYIKPFYDPFIKKSLSVTYCEHIGVLSLGTRIKRLGFLVKFEKGTAFWEFTCYKKDGIWELVNWNCQFKSDANELIKIIPAEYWKKE